MTEIQLENYDSKFRFILIAACRAEQLMRGARPKLDSGSPKVARGAMAEVNEGLIAWDYGPAPLPDLEDSEEGLEGGEEKLEVE